MNILLCGNEKVFDGALTQLISMTNKTAEAIKCYIFTMDATRLKPEYVPIEDEQIEEILNIKYGDPRIIPLFNELEHVASRPNDQVDHIWARSILSSKKAIKRQYPSITEGLIEQYKIQLNRLANLQVLDSVDNNEKSDTPYSEWVRGKYPNDKEFELYKQEHFIPNNISLEFSEFLQFVKMREELLKQKIKEAFPSDFNDLVVRYLLQDKLI